MKSFVLIFLMIASYCLAAPVNNRPITLVQPNGEKINCLCSGDEYHNWAHDKDGYTIIRNPKTGYWVYAVKDNNNIVASDYIVNRADPVKLGLAKYVNLSPDQILNIRNEKIKFREDIIKRTVHQYKKKGESILAPSKGFINNIVILTLFD